MERLNELNMQITYKLVQELAAAKKYFSAIIDSAGEAILTTNHNGQIHSFNRAAEMMLGYTLSEIEGLPLSTLFPLRHRNLYEKALQNFFRRPYEQKKSRQVWVQTKVGHRLPVKFTISELKVDKDIHYVIIAHDISYQKSTEDSLKQARREAERLNGLKSEFLAHMSHEIRTPLNGMIGLLQMIQTTHLTPQQAEYMTIINQSAELLQSIINDILELSKIEAGILDIRPDRFHLLDCVQNLVQGLSSAAKEKNLKVRIDFASHLPKWVVGDPSRIKQILMNLVGNAIKFTPAGEVRVCISSQGPSPGDENTEMIEFAIEDTGVGISEERLKSIFLPFVQADLSDTRPHGGSGLGLTISQRIAKALGGEIHVTSQRGYGSRFFFCIPLQRSSQVESTIESVSSTKTNAKTETLKACGTYRILLVEDNLINQQVTKLILESEGLNCDIANNGQEALDMIQKQEFDLILMDCQMPVMDGYETTRRIRKLQNSQAKIPIIAITANAFASTEMKCRQSGMTDFLTKPLHPRILHLKIKQHLAPT